MLATPPQSVAPCHLWTPLVRRVAAGDPEAMQELGATLSGLKGYLHLRFGPDETEDAFHELLLALFSGLQKGALKHPERLLGYVHAILRHQTAARIRLKIRARRVCDVTEVELCDPSADSEAEIARKERTAIAKRVLDSLPPVQREVLVRFYLKEQRPEQIQADLGITSTQFRLWKWRAKSKFEKLCRMGNMCSPRAQAQAVNPSAQRR